MRALAVAIVLLALLPFTARADDRGSITAIVTVAPDGNETIELTLSHPTTGAFFESYCLPRGATATSAVGEWGPITILPAPQGRISFYAMAHTTKLALKREFDDPFPPYHARNLNPCVWGDVPVHVEVRLPEGARAIRASPGAILGERMVSYDYRGVGALEYAFELPVPAWDVVEVGPFRMHLPNGTEAIPIAVAKRVSAALPRALAEAGVSMPWDQIVVRYGPFDVTWEGALYVGGGAVIMPTVVRGEDTEAAIRHEAGKLLHEAFHAATVPNGTGPFGARASWFVEGGARHAERAIEPLDHDAIALCSGCTPIEPYLDLETLEALYAANWTFDPGWTALDDQPFDDRALMYRYSEFLVAAYVTRFGEDAYGAVWDDLLSEIAKGGNASCPCDAGWIERSLRAHSGGWIPAEDLHYPHRALFRENITAFRETVRGLVRGIPAPAAVAAPEPVREPPGKPLPPPEIALPPALGHLLAPEEPPALSAVAAAETTLVHAPSNAPAAVLAAPALIPAFLLGRLGRR